MLTAESARKEKKEKNILKNVSGNGEIVLFLNQRRGHYQYWREILAPSSPLASARTSRYYLHFDTRFRASEEHLRGFHLATVRSLAAAELPALPGDALVALDSFSSLVFFFGSSAAFAFLRELQQRLPRGVLLLRVHERMHGLGLLTELREMSRAAVRCRADADGAVVYFTRDSGRCAREVLWAEDLGDEDDDGGGGGGDDADREEGEGDEEFDPDLEGERAVKGEDPAAAEIEELESMSNAIILNDLEDLDEYL